MIFLLNCFVTNQRPAYLNRYDRYQIFKYMLYSYRHLPFTDMYLFIKLDTEYNGLQEETSDYIYNLFHHLSRDNIHITYERYTKQEQWVSFITHLYKTNPEDMVFLCNNDDHIFIDVNNDLVIEGVELLKKEKNKLKSLYLSHFPEILKHSLLFEPVRLGNYVKCNLSLFDSIQIMGMELIYFIFVTHKWRAEHKRIDSVLDEVSLKPAITNEINQVLYISLRELCRKFNGYGHVGIDVNVFPPLHLPQNTFYYSNSDIEKRITVPHTGWTVMSNNKKEIPQEWITTSIGLYKGYPSHTIFLSEYYREHYNEDKSNTSSYLRIDQLFSFY
jgi:hypothetical protein